MITPTQPWPGTEDYFKQRILEVDALATVEFSDMDVRIRPSHPRYREAIAQQAWWHRCVGVAVSVVREVDDWEMVHQYELNAEGRLVRFQPLPEVKRKHSWFSHFRKRICRG